MNGLAWAALLGGMVLAALGFVLPDRLAGWRGELLSFLAPVGVALALLGVLLICVPHFFDEPHAVSAEVEPRLSPSGVSP